MNDSRTHPGGSGTNTESDMNTPTIPQVTKVQKGKKTVYMSNGQILRSSVREYKYALFGLLHTRWNPTTRKIEDCPQYWHIVGFGNNSINLINSWKNIFHCDRLEVVTIQ